MNEGQTLVQFRSVDNAGNVSAWTPSVNGANGLDRPQRAERADGDRWQRCDVLLRHKTVTASGGSDGAGSGLAHYQYRVSPDNGVTWGVTTSASSVLLAVHGVYLVQFQAVDNVGLLSAWAPANPGTTNTVCIN